MASTRKNSPDGTPADGPPVIVAWASHGVEAEMWAGLLKDHGIPSLVQRSPGADVPDFLASGRHTLRVRADHAERAREILQVVEDDPAEEADDGDRLVLERSPAVVSAAAVIAAVLLVSALLGVGVLLLL